MQDPAGIELAHQLVQHLTQLLGLGQAAPRAPDLVVHAAHRRPQAGEAGNRGDGPQEGIANRDRDVQTDQLEEHHAGDEVKAGGDTSPQLEAEDGLGCDQGIEEEGQLRRRLKEEHDPAADHDVVERQEQDGDPGREAPGGIGLRHQDRDAVVESDHSGQRSDRRQGSRGQDGSHGRGHQEGAQAEGDELPVQGSQRRTPYAA